MSTEPSLGVLETLPTEAAQIRVLRRALKRAIEERNAWRNSYLRLTARLQRLNLVQSEMVTLRGEVEL